MGFVATEAVEALTYDFRPFSQEHGEIPEPSSKQIDKYRETIVGSLREAGLDPEVLKSGKMSLDLLDDLMGKAKAVEEDMVVATADLTGIAPNTLRELPYRPKAAFLGWIMGQFFAPEA